MNDECSRCIEYAAEGKSFCGACGRPLGGAPPRRPQDGGPRRASGGLIGVVLAMLCMLVVFILAFEAMTLAVHSLDILSFLPSIRVSFPLLVPLPVSMFSLGGAALQAYWVAVVGVIFLCIAAALWRLSEAARGPGGITSPDGIENTAALWVSLFLCAMMAISFIVAVVCVAMGVEMTTPDFGDKLQTMFLVADAAVWEEIVTRLVLIGLPMTVISLIATGKAESLRCLLGGFGMSTAAVVLIIVSGAIFGLAHYSGWDDQAWKVLTAGIMGVFLGYVFVRFGLYASILMHFATNYLSSFDWMGVGGVGVMVTLLMMIAGFFALYYILSRLARSKDAINSLPVFQNGYIKGE
ncbi:MAG: CPBP family intramembrane metalloprotease [Methanomassiliicoccaceae archaeon]|nr:CPBP family intramembrane metalloprotease [Methanomassiliicoccaceae archaeon]